MNEKTVFGICADTHPEIMHDVEERIGVFLDDMRRRNVDFIIHLGDFCCAYSKNPTLARIWNAFPKPHYHTLGNHEMQGGYSQEQARRFLEEMPSRYYSFDHGGIHFVVLDANDARTDKPPKDPDFPSFIGKEQFEWLAADLAETPLKCVLFAHQSLLDDRDVENSDALRGLFREINESAGFRKIAAHFCGHYHTDSHKVVDDIHLIELNSMSNYWMGPGFERIRYGKELDATHPWIKYTAPYKDPLYAVVTIDSDEMRIEGIESEFVGPSPRELGFSHPHADPDAIVPRISSRILKL
jgi:3',5'-cyclic AMP phosphodiesterase CpdA